MAVMPAAREIPPALTKGPFRCDEAFDLGVTRRQLAGNRFRRIFHHVYVIADPPDSVELRCRAALLIAATGSVFCGFTAARLYRVPLPDSADDRVHLALPPGTSTIPRTAGRDAPVRPEARSDAQGPRPLRSTSGTSVSRTRRWRPGFA
ncbi:hypothetical protein [Actinomadura sp. HBU206391]|uniref:hypothetical protein n=1 Tax=Actinomadura sp. HBU206391 TaxID=2731692 RepID=UPI001650CE24|nr:hypothetical protein [Actinomadura sp. HBU206391]MBC6459219.1 hypothetical protein [Actinomadura sp. HBU206391]